MVKECFFIPIWNPALNLDILPNHELQSDAAFAVLFHNFVQNKLKFKPF